MPSAGPIARSSVAVGQGKIKAWRTWPRHSPKPPPSPLPSGIWQLHPWSLRSSGRHRRARSVREVHQGFEKCRPSPPLSALSPTAVPVRTCFETVQAAGTSEPQRRPTPPVRAPRLGQIPARVAGVDAMAPEQSHQTGRPKVQRPPTAPNAARARHRPRLHGISTLEAPLVGQDRHRPRLKARHQDTSIPDRYGKHAGWALPHRTGSQPREAAAHVPRRRKRKAAPLQRRIEGMRAETARSAPIEQF
jgi:hypothetical protein